MLALGRCYLATVNNSSSIQIDASNMRFTISALLVAMLQIPSHAFSPVMTRATKTSSSAMGKHSYLHVRRNHDDEESYSQDNQSNILPSMVLAGAAFQFSASKVSYSLMFVKIALQHLFPLLN